MSEESKDLLSDVWAWVAQAMGAKELPGRRVVSPRAKTVRQHAAYAFVPQQARSESARPHDAQ
jgi:hypothetical protein